MHRQISISLRGSGVECGERVTGVGREWGECLGNEAVPPLHPRPIAIPRFTCNLYPYKAL